MTVVIPEKDSLEKDWDEREPACEMMLNDHPCGRPARWIMRAECPVKLSSQCGQNTALTCDDCHEMAGHPRVEWRCRYCKAVTIPTWTRL